MMNLRKQRLLSFLGIPKTIYHRFKEIQAYLGYRNFSEFVNDKIRDAIKSEEYSASRLKNEIERAREEVKESSL